MSRFVISSHPFDLDPATVETAVEGVLPDPVQEHYGVGSGRRYPPKQVIAQVTGLDRADFTTHQARRVLKRLGFTAARRQPTDDSREAAPAGGGPHRGRQASALEPYVGKWVALDSP